MEYSRKGKYNSRKDTEKKLRGKVYQQERSSTSAERSKISAGKQQ
jgi:hypothetical protein